MAAIWLPLFQDHFVRYFQKPFDVQVFHSPDNYSLKVGTHDWGLPGYRVYASLGLADLFERRGIEPIGEIILCAEVPDPEVLRIFVHALFTIVQHTVPLDSRFAIGFAAVSQGFARRYDKTSLYVTRPFRFDVRFSNGPDGEGSARVFQAFFLSPAEDEFLENRGAHEFEQKFWPLFGEDMEKEELAELPETDEQRQQQFEHTMAKKRKAMQALSVRRPPCV